MRKLGSELLVGELAPSSHRLAKLASLISRELGLIIEREFELPRGVLLTITSVSVLADLSEARVGVSVLPAEQAQEIFVRLSAVAGRLQHILNPHLRLYRVPRLVFQLDSSLAVADHIEHLLDNIKTEE